MKRLFLLYLLLLGTALAAGAQCTSNNTAFRSGETLSYDLYFNWKFVWLKAGTASMNITQTTYRGQPAYKAYLITRGSQKADHFFVMRDTLTAYTTLDLLPLYYRKGALEGKTYRQDEVWYSYPGQGQMHLRMRHQKNQEQPLLSEQTSRVCVFDMISMLMRARSFDPSRYKKGYRIRFPMADGHKVETQDLVFRGKKKFKMDHTGITYRCLVFSFVEKDKKNKEHDVVTFYITDDKNHLPVRLDLNLNFGTAKAFLTGATGLRNPQDARL